jgi:uncharacterized protein (DUF2147 family)
VKRLTIAAAAIFLAVGGPASASPVGEWRIADGSANVAIHPCGGDLCGSVSWSKDGQMIGKPVLINMKPNGDRWEGLIVDARNGRRYTARISLRGEATLKVQGCVLGGLICGGQLWSRVK